MDDAPAVLDKIDEDRDQDAELSTDDASGADEAADRPPSRAHSMSWRIAKRAWWLPWVLGAAAGAVGVATIMPLINGSDGNNGNTPKLPTSTHRVTYDITGTGVSPEIRYLTDGVAAADTIDHVNMPWHKDLTLTVGPGIGIAQIVAANNNTSASISCSISVDGVQIYHATSPGQASTVACSAVIRP